MCFFWGFAIQVAFPNFCCKDGQMRSMQMLGRVTTWVPFHGGLVRGNVLNFQGIFGLVKYDSMFCRSTCSKKSKRKLQLKKSCFCWGGKNRSVWDTPSLLITSWAGHLRGWRFSVSMPNTLGWTFQELFQEKKRTHELGASKHQLFVRKIEKHPHLGGLQSGRQQGVLTKFSHSATPRNKPLVPIDNLATN